MATDNYWMNEKENLLDEEFGAMSYIPFDVPKLLNGFAFSSSNQNVVKLRVLGLEDQANELLLSYYQPLKDILSDSSVCNKLQNPTPGEVNVSLGYHLETLSIAHWLKTGKFDSDISLRAVNEQPEDFDGGFAPTLNSALLIAIEAKQPLLAEKIYLRWEKNPLLAMPTNQRYSGNTRHLLMAHLRFYAEQAEHIGFLNEGLNRFCARAKKWEKADAVPYIGILDLARIVFQCKLLSSHPIGFPELWLMIK